MRNRFILIYRGYGLKVTPHHMAGWLAHIREAPISRFYATATFTPPIKTTLLF